MDEDIQRHLWEGRHDEAFAALLERYRVKVFRLAYGILLSEAAAEDVAQDVFVKLWRALPRYDGRASLSTWIYAIARNTSLTARKRQRPTLSLSEPESARALESLPELQTAQADGGQLLDVGVLLSALPEKYRRVVVLFYMEQRSYEETAEMMGVPLGTVKTYLHRARKELAEMAQRTGGSAEDVMEVAT